MDASKKFLKNNNILTRISFKEQAKHTFTIISDELKTIKDDKGVDKEGVQYTVEEDGEKKTFFTTSVGLIQRLAEYESGTVVTAEMKSKKGANGFTTFFEVSSDNKKEEEIPTVQVGDEEIKEEDLPF